MSSLATEAAIRPVTRPQTRELIVAWQHPTERSIDPIGRLSFDGSSYEFAYVAHALTVHDFHPLLGFPDVDERYRSERLFPLFAQRVMTPNRPDYVRYIDRLGLEADDDSPWEQIARSGGGRQGDTLQLIPVPEVAPDGRIDFPFSVNGVRHIPDKVRWLGGQRVHVSQEQLDTAVGSLSADDPLRLVIEPENPKNPHALVVMTTDQIPIGYLPNLLTRDVGDLMESGTVDVAVLRANGPEAPIHMRVLVRLVASSHPHFRFFESEGMQPLGT